MSTAFTVLTVSIALFLAAFFVLCYFGVTHEPEETADPPELEDQNKESQK